MDDATGAIYSAFLVAEEGTASTFLQDRLVNALALAGITDIEAANAFLREVYLPAHNARFAVPPAGEGSAFTPIPGVDLDDILCVEEERQVGHDNCVSDRTLKAPDPAKPDAAPFRQGAGQGPHLRRRLPRRLTGPAASAATTRTERSQMPKRRLNPLGGEPRGRHGQASGLPTPPTRQNKSRRSGHMLCYQNRTT